MKHSIREGNSVFLGHDNWHPEEPLHPKYGYRIIYDVASPFHAEVASIKQMNKGIVGNGTQQGQKIL